MPVDDATARCHERLGTSGGFASLAAFDDEDPGVACRLRVEPLPRNSPSGPNHELHRPATGTWSTSRRPPVDSPARQHEMGGLQSAPVVKETAQHGTRDRIGRVGDDVERASWQAEVGRIGSYDRDLPAESLLEVAGASVMQFDGDDVIPSRHQVTGDRPGAGADVENERSPWQRRVSDDVSSGLLIELVPSPPRL